jgi:hypothetical protein
MQIVAYAYFTIDMERTRMSLTEMNLKTYWEPCWSCGVSCESSNGMERSIAAAS